MNFLLFILNFFVFIILIKSNQQKSLTKVLKAHNDKEILIGKSRIQRNSLKKNDKEINSKYARDFIVPLNLLRKNGNKAENLLKISSKNISANQVDELLFISSSTHVSILKNEKGRLALDYASLSDEDDFEEDRYKHFGRRRGYSRRRSRLRYWTRYF